MGSRRQGHGNEKGIAVKIDNGEIVIDIDEDTFRFYLATVPKSYKSWRRWRCIPRPGSFSFHIEPVHPADSREVKITGPDEFKKAG